MNSKIETIEELYENEPQVYRCCRYMIIIRYTCSYILVMDIEIICSNYTTSIYELENSVIAIQTVDTRVLCCGS